MKRNPFIKDILEEWNIQCYVIASLVFQMILVFLAPMRRWLNNGFMYLVIWAVYLLASFFSTFALSLIYNNAPKEVNKSDIFPFWAPFLLVHLGGPHTITALAMEDNNLWHRHLLTQAVQVFSVLVVLYQYQIFQSEWLLPTAIVFLVGIVKCFERIVSLQLASFNFVRRSIRQQNLDKGNAAENNDENNCVTFFKRILPPAGDVGKTTLKDDKGGGGGGKDSAAATAAAGDVVGKKKLKDDKNGLNYYYEIVKRGYEFYQTFKGFIIDHTFTNNNECGKDKEWFSEQNLDDAFEVMEMELNFMYQAMFTKMIAVQYWENNYFWCIWRFVCDALLITVAVIFFCHSKHHLQPADIGITYCLLGGAILLDEIALVHLIFSHWTIAKIMDYYYDDKTTEVGKKVVRTKILPVINVGLKVFTVKKCWSGKIIQYSLVKHSLTGRWKWAEHKLEFYSLKEVIDSGLHTTTAVVGEELKKLVMEDIKRKAAKTCPQAAPEGLHLVLHIIHPLVKEHTSDYATIVLILHVATEICYFTSGKGEGDEEEAKLLCIEISEYLAYLLVLEGKITSALPGSIGMRFKDICLEQSQHTFNHLYDTFNPKHVAGTWCRKRTSRQKACDYLIKEYSSSCNDEYEKSVLPTAVDLAKALMNIQCADPETGNNKQQHHNQMSWKGLSQVWVELLVYASSHCRGDVYYLNKGGQFYTFVRLLMAHFGLQDILKGERPFELRSNEIHY